MRDNESDQLNVLAETLELCSDNPKTGFLRDGCCHYHNTDIGMHFICVQVTEQFLTFSKQVGNDLSTPVEDYDFPGLKPGDKWCLCTKRWLEAYNNNCAPNVYLLSTHYKALDIIPIDILKKFSVDLG